MSPRVKSVALGAIAVVAVAGCGGSSSSSESKADSQQAVKDWITAAVEQDGKKYCGLMTKDLLEKTTGAQSDQAMKKCEDAVKSKKGSQLPLSIYVQPGAAGKTSAEATIEASLPKQPIKLRKEDGDFKVDSVE